MASYTGKWAHLDQLTSVFIQNALAELGIFRNAGEQWTAQTLGKATFIQPTYVSLVDRWLQRLVQDGVLTKSENGFVSTEPIKSTDLSKLILDTRCFFGPDTIFLDYALRCGPQLARIVSGNASALETLFPSGDSRLAEDLYERAPVSAYIAGIARAVLESVLRSRPSETLHIIEIGAGTGATTAALLPVLSRDRASYRFTDISEFFLSRAQAKFSAYDFIEYGLLDIEKEAQPPSVATEAFDVVVATNVLHATTDLPATLRRVRQLLRPGGVLILCEATEYLSWYDITTALIEGWRVFRDDIRKDVPLIASSVWQSLLSEAGFSDVDAFPRAGMQSEVLGQHVFIARQGGHQTRSTERNVVRDAQNALPLELECSTNDVLERLREHMPSERLDLLVEIVRAQLASVLRVSSDTLSRKSRLVELGVDSLMAVEFRTRLSKRFKLSTPLSSTLVFDFPTIEAIASHLLDTLLPQSTLSAVAAAGFLTPSQMSDIATSMTQKLSRDSFANCKRSNSSKHEQHVRSHRRVVAHQTGTTRHRKSAGQAGVSRIAKDRADCDSRHGMSRPRSREYQRILAAA